MVPGMVPNRFLTAADMVIMPWDFSLQKSMIASAFCSHAVQVKLRIALPSGKCTSATEKS